MAVAVHVSDRNAAVVEAEARALFPVIDESELPGREVAPAIAQPDVEVRIAREARGRRDDVGNAVAVHVGDGEGGAPEAVLRQARVLDLFEPEAGSHARRRQALVIGGRRGGHACRRSLVGRPGRQTGALPDLPFQRLLLGDEPVGLDVEILFILLEELNGQRNEWVLVVPVVDADVILLGIPLDDVRLVLLDDVGVQAHRERRRERGRGRRRRCGGLAASRAGGRGGPRRGAERRKNKKSFHETSSKVLRVGGQGPALEHVGCRKNADPPQQSTLHVRSDRQNAAARARREPRRERRPLPRTRSRTARRRPREAREA